MIFFVTFRCSERAISFAEFREILPSRCTLGESFCQGTCHAIGRRDGSCEYGQVSFSLHSTAMQLSGKTLEVLTFCIFKRVVNALKKDWLPLSSHFVPRNPLVPCIVNARVKLTVDATVGNVSVWALLQLLQLKFEPLKLWNDLISRFMKRNKVLLALFLVCIYVLSAAQCLKMRHFLVIFKRCANLLRILCYLGTYIGHFHATIGIICLCVVLTTIKMHMTFNDIRFDVCTSAFIPALISYKELSLIATLHHLHSKIKIIR